MIIKFDKKSLNISSKGNITGVITLAIDNQIFFPERNWNDSIVLILISWINNVNELLSGKVSDERFFFFDGPFMFVIRNSE